MPNNSDKWDIYSVSPDGSNPAKVVENGSWASWIGPTRSSRAWKRRSCARRSGSGKETEIMNSAGVSDLTARSCNRPKSHDGNFMRLRSAAVSADGNLEHREQDLDQDGARLSDNWMPDRSVVYWVNPTGNGGSEVFQMPVRDGNLQGVFR